MQDMATETDGRPRIFHVSSRENIKELRDEILRLHGFEVQSALFSQQTSQQTLDEVSRRDYDLILIDVESDTRVQSAQELCDNIKKVVPKQHVAFVCNYRVGIVSDCPDEIIRAEFNPEAMVRGVQNALVKNEKKDQKTDDAPVA
jgi:response regulator RpfG family c-di-GMP phosphodiesterase